jgi:hypothetical protein
MQTAYRGAIKSKCLYTLMSELASTCLSTYTDNNTLCAKHMVFKLSYSFSDQMEAFLSPVFFIIFVFSEVLMCLSTFRLAYVSDNCARTACINNLSFIIRHLTRIF